MKKILQKIADSIIQNKEYLTVLDAACGDGDMGVVMYLGFKKAKEELDQVKSVDIGVLFGTVGSTVLTSVGGASGPLFGSLFNQAGRVAKGKDNISLEDLAAMFESSLNKISSLGGAKVGDKTLVDALEPAVKALKEASSKDLSLEVALEKASEAARLGAESTKKLEAKYGKAKYLGEKSIGYLDPGAKVTDIIFEAFISGYKS